VTIICNLWVLKYSRKNFSAIVMI